MINTYSSILYGFTVTSDNNAINFQEGASDLVAYVDVGNYTATTICEAIETAMNAEGAYTYTCTFSRATRIFTIASSSASVLLKNTGLNVGTSIWSTIGFSTAADSASLTSHVGTIAAGTLYEPQYWLQDYVSSEDYQQAVDATVNKSASGKVQVYQVGTEKFVEFNIKWITNLNTTGSKITYNATGVDAARLLMRFLVTKAPFEFMPDADTPATFQTLILESTSSSPNGTGYKLDEQYERGLAGFYETGKLKMRVIE